jgi:peptidoglycan/LPS O-acetylase OafA/YrhL
MMFYLIFPLIYGYVKDVWKATAFIFIFILVWLAYQTLIPFIYEASSASLVETWTFIRFLPVFAVGGVVHFIVQDIHSRAEVKLQASIGLLLVTVALYSYLALLNDQLKWLFMDARVWQGLIYGTLVVGLCLNPLRIFVNRFTTYLGKISYSLYLGHTTVVLFLTPVYRHIYALTGYITVPFLLCYFLTLAIAIGLADITYRFIEAPGVRLGKVVYRWITGRLGTPIEQQPIKN